MAESATQTSSNKENIGKHWMKNRMEARPETKSTKGKLNSKNVRYLQQGKVLVGSNIQTHILVGVFST